jgi:hypothetical protein
MDEISHMKMHFENAYRMHFFPSVLVYRFFGEIKLLLWKAVYAKYFEYTIIIEKKRLGI